MAVYRHGFVALWLFSYVAMLLCIYVAMWLRRSVAMWLFGYELLMNQDLMDVVFNFVQQLGFGPGPRLLLKRAHCAYCTRLYAVYMLDTLCKSYIPIMHGAYGSFKL